jgi:hypothetical protein
MLSQRAEVREWKAVPMGMRRGFYTGARPAGLDYDTRTSTMAKILLVEDNEMNRDMLSRRLQRKGFLVVIAEDGKAGVAMAQSEAPDLILLDMSLPIVDGWEAARQIKAGAKTKASPSSPSPPMPWPGIARRRSTRAATNTTRSRSNSRVSWPRSRPY